MKYGVTIGVIWVYAWRCGPSLVRSQVVEVRPVHPQECRQADDEVERQHEGGDGEEVAADGIAWASRASATNDVDRNVRNMPARTNASL